MVNPRWTGFTHTAKAQMQCQDDLPIPSETPLNLKMFNARLTRSLIPASSCGFRLKDFELPIQDESEVQLYNLSVGLLQCSRSGVHRKVGNVALISPTGVPGLDLLLSSVNDPFEESYCGMLRSEAVYCRFTRIGDTQTPH